MRDLKGQEGGAVADLKVEQSGLLTFRDVQGHSRSKEGNARNRH